MLFDFLIGKAPGSYNPDFSASQKVITDLEQRYGQSPTAVDQTGQLQLNELGKQRDIASETAAASVASNVGTTQAMSRLGGADTVGTQAIGRAGVIGALAAQGGVSDKYSQLSDILPPPQFSPP